ncbi:hypothetical protein C0991_000395 [Blastosporella zonata]|nr:hypothetical protein C0991_000395 [Blastosporella zonata]
MYQSRADSMEFETKVAEITNEVWRATPYSNLSHIDALLKSCDTSEHPKLLNNQLLQPEFDFIWTKSTAVDYIGYMCEGFALRIADEVLKSFPAGEALYQHTGDDEKLGHGFVAMQKPSAAAGDPYQLVDSSIGVSISLPATTYIYQVGTNPFTAYPGKPDDNPHAASLVLYRSTAADIYYWEKAVPLTVEDPTRITAKLNRDQMIARTRRQARGNKGLGPTCSILLVHSKDHGPNVLSVWLISYPSTRVFTLKTFAEGIVTFTKTWIYKDDVSAIEADIKTHIENIATSGKTTQEETVMMYMVFDNLKMATKK